MAPDHIYQVFKYAVSPGIRAFNCYINSTCPFYRLGHWGSDRYEKEQAWYSVWLHPQPLLSLSVRPLPRRAFLPQLRRGGCQSRNVHVGLISVKDSLRNAAHVWPVSEHNWSNPRAKWTASSFLPLARKKITEGGEWKGPLSGSPPLSIFQVCGYYI